MKNFFKILRKIIKILLKTILWLILGIIVIGGVVLLIINNRTLKFYENDDTDMKFTMNQDFKVKDGIELKINLKGGCVRILEFENGYIYSDGIININLTNLSLIKQLYKQGDVENFLEILQYCFDADYTEYYDNGQISEKLQFINGLEDGPYISYYKNGQIEEEGNFINGNENGIRTGYYNDGYIAHIFDKDNGILTGYYKKGNVNYINHYSGYNITYYENGNIFYEGYSKYGKLDGIVTGYYIDGNIVEISNYDGNGNYYSTFFNQDGTIFGTGNQDEGSEIYIHKNGQIKLILNSNGIGTGYYENGNIAFIGNYSTGNLIIHGTEYSNEGYILTTCDYDGNGNGYRIYRGENGDILGTGKFIDNEIVDGLYIDYSSNNGQILEKGNYIDGYKDGYRVEYFEDGQIYSEGNYNNGKKVGLWNWYLGDGSIGVSKNYDE